MNYYLKVLQNYTNFDGRARRKEFWLFIFFNMLTVIILSIFDDFLGTVDTKGVYGLFGSIYILVVFIPSIAVSIRRLHDTGRSGWWLLLNLIPLLGSLVVLIFFIQNSESHENRYGINPKFSDFNEFT